MLKQDTNEKKKICVSVIQTNSCMLYVPVIIHNQPHQNQTKSERLVICWTVQM